MKAKISEPNCPGGNDKDSVSTIRDNDIKINNLTLSEENYRSLVENSLAGIVIGQGDPLRVVYVNKTYTHITGYTFDEKTSMQFDRLYELVHPDDRDEFFQRYKMRIQGEDVPDKYEFRLIHKDGSIKWVEVSSKIIEFQGEPAVQAEFIDITSRKQAETWLAQSEERYRAVVEQSEEIIFLADLETMQITESNPAMKRLLGYNRTDAVGLTIYQLIDHPREEIDHNIKQIIEKGKYFLGQRRYKHKDGTIVHVEVGVSKISFGGKAYMSIVARDITNRLKAEHERDKLIEELKDALAKIKTLRGLIPICASCKKIRDDQGYWNQIEEFIIKHSHAEFSHSICPDCTQKLYPNIYEKKQAESMPKTRNKR